MGFARNKVLDMHTANAHLPDSNKKMYFYYTSTAQEACN